MQTDALRILRAIKKYSQPEVAKVLGVSLHTYRKKEADINLLTIREANLLIKFYGIKPDVTNGIFFAFDCDMMSTLAGN